MGVPTFHSLANRPILLDSQRFVDRGTGPSPSRWSAFTDLVTRRDLGEMLPFDE